MPSLHTQMARLIHHLSSSYLAVSIITLFSGLHCFVRLMARSDMFQIKSLLWGNFVVVQLKELRCLQEHSLPQKRPSVYFSEWILKVDLCRAQCRGPNGAHSMNHRYQELCIPNGKNTTSWVSTSGPTPLWSWLLFGCRVDPVENATHAPWRGTLETSVGRGAQTGADGIVQTAAVCPSAQPLILTSLNQQSSLSNQVPVFFYFVENCIALVGLKTLNLVCPTRFCICHQSGTAVPPTTSTSCHSELWLRFSLIQALWEAGEMSVQTKKARVTYSHPAIKAGDHKPQVSLYTTYFLTCIISYFRFLMCNKYHSASLLVCYDAYTQLSLSDPCYFSVQVSFKAHTLMH